MKFVLMAFLFASFSMANEYAISSDDQLYGLAHKTLIINSEIALTDDRTVPKNISLRFTQGGFISLGDYDLTIEGTILAGPYRIFDDSGDGKVTGNPILSCVYPEWWQSPTQSDWTAALQSAASIYPRTNYQANVVQLQSREYEISDTIVLDGMTSIIGKGRKSVIKNTNDAAYAFQVLVPIFAEQKQTSFKISDMTIESAFGINVNNNESFSPPDYGHFMHAALIENVTFFGSYNHYNDTERGTLTVPTYDELGAYSTAILCNTLYNSRIQHCYFENYGIAIASFGDTASGALFNRFNKNGRHLHRETIDKTSGGVVPFGSDYQFLYNDCLGAKRVGAIYVNNTRADNISYNYIENVHDETVSEVFRIIDTDEITIAYNHLNPAGGVSNSVNNRQVMYLDLGSANTIHNNKVAPYPIEKEPYAIHYEYDTEEYSDYYPFRLSYYNNTLLPRIERPFARETSEISAENVLRYNNVPEIHYEGLPFKNIQIVVPEEGYVNPFRFSSRVNKWCLSGHVKFRLRVDNPLLSTNLTVSMIGGLGTEWTTITGIFGSSTNELYERWHFFESGYFDTWGRKEHTFSISPEEAASPKIFLEFEIETRAGAQIDIYEVKAEFTE